MISFSDIGLDRMRTLLITARDILYSAAHTLSVFVQLSTLFIPPLLLSSPAPTSSLLPNIDRVRFVTPSVEVVTFTASLNILDTQSNFDHILGLNSIIIHIVLRNQRQYATEDT